FPVVTVALSGPGAGTITDCVGGLDGDQITDTGWYIKPQTITGTNKQWVVAATANETATTDTIAYGEWSDPVQFSGADGADGFNSATVEIWKLTNSTTETTKPSGDSRYTFDSGALTFTTANGWGYKPTSAQATPVANNKYLHKRTAAAIGKEIYTDIDDGDWSDPIIAAQYGQIGNPGKKTLITLIYLTAPTSGATPVPDKPVASGSQTYSFANNTITNVSAWSFTPPAFDASGEDAYYWASIFTTEEDTAEGGSATVTAS
ncbi:uncharacterized protein METZ01_LOCUS439645, partial [marine metagenome]